jgi:hypothetical protein
VINQAQGILSHDRDLFIKLLYRLLTVDVNIISNAECKSKNNVYSTKVVDTMLCASVPQGGKVHIVLPILIAMIIIMCHPLRMLARGTLVVPWCLHLVGGIL